MSYAGSDTVASVSQTTPEDQQAPGAPEEPEAEASKPVAARARASRTRGAGLRDRVRRFLQRPGTVDLAPYRKALPRIAAREDELKELAGEQLAESAGDAVEDADLCAA